MQAKLFEQSVSKLSCSSNIFVRRFSNSKIATVYDSLAFLDDTLTEDNVFDALKTEFKSMDYGIKKINSEVMYWMGYIYRYLIYVYQISSKQAYRYLKPNELANAYLGYHSLDPKQAVDRLLEAKNIFLDEESKKKIAIEYAKKIRKF
jgi:hypothetical protein